MLIPAEALTQEETHTHTPSFFSSLDPVEIDLVLSFILTNTYTHTAFDFAVVART